MSGHWSIGCSKKNLNLAHILKTFGQFRLKSAKYLMNFKFFCIFNFIGLQLIPTREDRNQPEIVFDG